MALAELMKNARNNRGLTLREVSRVAKISITLLHSIENSKQLRPKMDTLNKLAAYYDLPIDEVCISATRIPQDCFFKIVRCPKLLQVIRDYPE